MLNFLSIRRHCRKFFNEHKETERNTQASFSNFYICLPLNVLQVSVTCTFSSSQNKNYPIVTYGGTGISDSNGAFIAVLGHGHYPPHGGIDNSFMSYVYVNGTFDLGLCAGVKLQGCQITGIVGGSQNGCSVMAYNSGTCSGGGDVSSIWLTDSQTETEFIGWHIRHVVSVALDTA